MFDRYGSYDLVIEIGDPQALDIELRVNGATRQRGNV